MVGDARHLQAVPDPPPNRPKRSVNEIMDSRPTITVAGAKAIGRPPVGNIDVPLLDVSWRSDKKDKRRGRR